MYFVFRVRELKVKWYEACFTPTNSHLIFYRHSISSLKSFIHPFQTLPNSHIANKAHHITSYYISDVISSIIKKNKNEHKVKPLCIPSLALKSLISPARNNFLFVLVHYSSLWFLTVKRTYFLNVNIFLFKVNLITFFWTLSYAIYKYCRHSQFFCWLSVYISIICLIQKMGSIVDLSDIELNLLTGVLVPRLHPIFIISPHICIMGHVIFFSIMFLLCNFLQMAKFFRRISWSKTVLKVKNNIKNKIITST